MADPVQSRWPYPLALGRSAFWFAVNRAGRTFRHSKQHAKSIRRHVYHRARYTSTGRAMLAVSELLSSPRDAVRRRRVVATYNRRHPSRQMDRAEGYAMLPAGSIAGADDIMRLSLRLFEAKYLEIAESTRPGETHTKKWSFLRSVLTNQDLARNPELVDFALSDGLLSLATNYLGTIPHLNRIDLLYSVAHGGEEVISSQLYHLDPEGTRQAKLFLNLRDVGPDEGPFTFIPASESRRIAAAVKKRRSVEGRVVEGRGRYLDREIEDAGGLRHAISVSGPAGSAALVDTSRCLHLGSRVSPGTYRLCLYIQYCTSREYGNMFDLGRFAGDPVRYLATVNSRRSPQAAVAAPHQMT